MSFLNARISPFGSHRETGAQKSLPMFSLSLSLFLSFRFAPFLTALRTSVPLPSPLKEETLTRAGVAIVYR